MMEEEQATVIVQTPWPESNKVNIPVRDDESMVTLEGPKVKEALVKQARRILRVLRSPKKQRHSLQELNSNTLRERKYG